MKIVLITAIGGDVSQSVASVIKESCPDIRLIGTDINLEHAGSLFVNELLQVPKASSIRYLEKMREIIKSYSVDLVIPISEPELSVFKPLIDELGKQRCITAGQSILDIGLDKLKTAMAIKSLGIAIPWSVSADTQSPIEFPCILKSCRGAGSKNVFVVENNEEAIFLARKFPNSIFQELLEPADKEVTCAVYRRKDGQTAVLQLLRKLTSGYTSWAKVINDRATLDMCKAIAKGLNLNGSINIQLRLTKNGPRVFEINPRFSSTALMRHRIGFSDVLWAIDEAEGKVIDFPDIVTDECMVRVHDTKKIY